MSNTNRATERDDDAHHDDGYQVGDPFADDIVPAQTEEIPLAGATQGQHPPDPYEGYWRGYELGGNAHTAGNDDDEDFTPYDAYSAQPASQRDYHQEQRYQASASSSQPTSSAYPRSLTSHQFVELTPQLRLLLSAAIPSNPVDAFLAGQASVSGTGGPFQHVGHHSYASPAPSTSALVRRGGNTGSTPSSSAMANSFTMDDGAIMGDVSEGDSDDRYFVVAVCA